MNGKPKRDITLGEMQDECKTRVKICNGCPYEDVCGEIPKLLDLTDPPRFSDEAMALLAGFRAIGAKSIKETHGFFVVIGEDGNAIKLADALGISDEQIDLAELIGEDGAHAK